MSAQFGTLKTLNYKIKEILVGIILGDSHIRKSGYKLFITVEQSIVNKNNVIHLYEKFEGINLYEIKYYSK